MGRIPDELITEIRERSDIVAIIGEHVELKKAGTSFKGLCPFHQEKTPSFHVVPQKHFFHCFGCQKSGDVLSFLMEFLGKSFVEAARELGARCGVDVPDRDEDPRAQRRRDEKRMLFDVNAAALAFFREVLLSDHGRRAREYLASRGIGDEVAETFGLGMAPDGWTGLADRLRARRIPMEPAVVLGLVGPRRQGSGYYDKFRNRLICPIKLPGGEVAAFSGRTLGDKKDEPKYINSPNSPVYTKGDCLYGLAAARPAFRQKGRAVLVEGNFDVVALHQAGFAETVGTLGTALTDKQVRSLHLVAPRVILCLDGDASGRAAALRHIEPLVAAGMDTRVALLPDKDDPDSFVRREGAGAFEALLSRAQPAVEYFIHEVWARSGRSSDERARALREAAPLLRRVADEARREILIGEVSAALDIQPHVVRRAVQVGKIPEIRGSAAAVRRPSAYIPLPGKELKILAILADHPDLAEKARDLNVGSLLTDERIRDMYSAALAGRPLMEVVPSEPPELKDLVVREVLSGQYSSLQDPSRTLEDVARSLERERLASEAEKLGAQIKEAERRGDAARARELILLQLRTRTQAEALK